MARLLLPQRTVLESVGGLWGNKKWKRKLEVIVFIILFENKTTNFSAFAAIWLLYDQKFVLLSSKAEESPAQNKHSAKIIKFG